MDPHLNEFLYVVTGVATAANLSDDARDASFEWIRRTVTRLASSFSNPYDLFSNEIGIKAWRGALAADHALISLDVRCAIKLILAVLALRSRTRHGLETTCIELSLIWELVYSALIHSEQTQDFHLSSTRSAQGFLTTPLCSVNIDGRLDSLYRLHVWLPDSHRGLAGWEVHSHQAAAQSWILAGEGTDYSYSVEDSAIADATHSQHIPHWASAKQKELERTYQTHRTTSQAIDTGRCVSAKVANVQTYRRGASYSIPAGDYHETIVPNDGFYATLFCFDSQQGYIHDAGVLGPVNGTDSVRDRNPGVNTPSSLASLVQVVRQKEQQPPPTVLRAIEGDALAMHTTCAVVT